LAALAVESCAARGVVARVTDAEPDADAVADSVADTTRTDVIAAPDIVAIDASDASASSPLALAGLSFRGIAVTSDRTAIDRSLRLYYIDSRGQLRSELRSATLARTCSIDLGAPPGVTLLGTPSAAHHRETVVAAGRASGGAIEYWARFAAAGVTSCGQPLGPWTLVPSLPRERWATAPNARLLAHFNTVPRVVVSGVAESGRVMFVDRNVDDDGPTGSFTGPRLVDSADPSDVVRAAPHARQRGGDLGYLFTLARDERGGYSYFASTQILLSRTWWMESLEQRYFGATLPPWRPSLHEWERPDAPNPYCEAIAWTRGNAVWASMNGVANSGENLTYASRSIGTPFPELSADVPVVVLANGPGRPEQLGREGSLYAIAQSSTEPTRLRFATQRSFEWFNSPAPVVWTEAPDRLE